MGECKEVAPEYLLDVSHTFGKKGWKFYNLGTASNRIPEKEAYQNGPVTHLQKDNMHCVLPKVANPLLKPKAYVRALLKKFNRESGDRPVPRIRIAEGFKKFEVGETTERGFLKTGDEVPFARIMIDDQAVYLIAYSFGDAPFETAMIPLEVFTASLPSLNDISHLTDKG